MSDEARHALSAQLVWNIAGSKQTYRDRTCRFRMEEKESVFFCTMMMRCATLWKIVKRAKEQHAHLGTLQVFYMTSSKELLELPLSLEVFIKKKCISLIELTDFISRFPDKWSDFANRRSVRGNARENWCVFRLLPLMLG